MPVRSRSSFGAAWAKILVKLLRLFTVVSQPQPALRYRIEAQGWLTDIDGAVTLRVPAAAFRRVIVDVERGNIRVTDTTRAGAVREKRVQLEVHTARGHVQSSATDRASP
ncbi:MAG: hypothetical protein ACLPQ6_15750 [Steroidobacteraceae bacterium]|jgi:ferric-dicitrate binding protein FerR (iron transport regulator)